MHRVLLFAFLAALPLLAGAQPVSDNPLPAAGPAFTGGCASCDRLPAVSALWDRCRAALTGDPQAKWSRVLTAAPRRLIKLAKGTLAGIAHGASRRQALSWCSKQLRPLRALWSAGAAAPNCESGRRRSAGLIWCR